MLLYEYESRGLGFHKALGRITTLYIRHYTLHALLAFFLLEINAPRLHRIRIQDSLLLERPVLCTLTDVYTQETLSGCLDKRLVSPQY